MGAFLSLLIILVLMYILGVDIHIIMGIVLGLGALIILVMEIFFIVSAFILAGTRKCQAVFSRIDKGQYGFDRVFYTIDGKEYENAFPCEVTLRDAIYKPDKTVNVRLSEKIGKVYDLNAQAAECAGLVLCTIGCVLSGILVFSVI